MKKHFSKILAVFGLIALLASSACENIAIIKRPTPQLDGDEIVGEITGIDLRANRIHLRSTEDGRRATPRTIRLEESTQLLYRGREYPLSSLEVGDIVALQVREREHGSSTNLLRLEQNSKDRQARQSGAGSQRIEGTVEKIDLDGGAFELRERSGNNVRVSLSPSAHAPVAEQVYRLRRGDQVLAEGRFLSRDRFELEDLL